MIHDAIVIGSGPGGATLARELAGRGARVLLLERGADEPVRGRLAQMLRIGAWPGRSAFLTPQGMLVIRGLATGGSSVINYATAWPPPAWLASRYGIDLAGELAAVRAELPIAPLADRLLGPMARRIMAAACSLGLDWQKLDKLIDQSRCRAGCELCSYGCPYGAKWQAGDFVADAVGRGATLVAGARVERVSRAPAGTLAVSYVHRGRRQQARAARVICAAGGLGTPPILRASGIAAAGRQLFLDPVVLVLGAVDSLRVEPGERAGHEVPMAAGCYAPETGIMLADLTLPRPMYWAFAAQVGRVDRLFAHQRTLGVMVKARDGLGGEVSRRGWPRKRLAGEDAAALAAGTDIARAILAAAGARRVFQTARFAAHPGAGAAIGQVVDADLETEIPNLFVCDASVLPEPWGLPPSLTLILLARRLARHLAAA